jgi:Heterokaryon incompatibility protein (HET)
MRLLKLDDDGRYSQERFEKEDIPQRYAILSHTWGQGKDDEVTYKDLMDGTGHNKPGFKKLEFCGKQAKHDDLHYFWVDTCCIDKSNENELATAINSMFRWYKNAERCYVYLSDVSVHTENGSEHVDWESSFRNSRWFTRGWTLQELLAPKIVEFYSRDCVRLGDKKSLEHKIHEVTGISIDALQGRPLSEFSIDERLSWGERRQTKEDEDHAYCLLGIFDVHMPLVHAEGRENAMRRLLREIEQCRQYRPQARSKIGEAGKRYWHVSRRSNTLFTGQGELRKKLKDRLLPSAVGIQEPCESKIFVLHGIGGVGKSELCIKFAEEHRDW